MTDTVYVTCKYLTLLSFVKPALHRDEGKTKARAGSAPFPAMRKACDQILLAV